nr:glycosyltransferase [Turicibacter bilis]
MIRNLAVEKENKIELKDNSLVIATVARLTKAKNLFIIIEAMKILRGKYKIKWFIVGDGELKKELSDLISLNDLNEEIILVGAKPNPYTFMNQADIYVQTSSWEGFGITVAEAKCLCKPIIVSNIPEFTTQITHKKTGLVYSNLAELVNCIETLVSDSELKANLSNNLKVEIHQEIKQITQLNNLLNRRD